MAKKITLTCTLPDGSKASRTTARTYTHVVCGRRSYDEAMRRANSKAAQKHDGKNWDYYAACAAGTYRYAHWYSAEAIADGNAKGRAWIEENGNDRAGYVQRCHMERQERVQAAKLAGEFDRWQALNWASRADLAHKAAASANRHGYYAKTVVVPVDGAK